MKVFFISLALASSAIAASIARSSTDTTCKSGQVVVCKGNGNGLISLGNIAPGLLGASCSGGDVYCCSQKDIEQYGLINLNLNAQCSLNRVL
ncbi:uncharacterized protein N7484_005453 [Penicillium longicatenatum]|uniref:uncharacterized protein n=1 Tax=Penicillium longicatenatum TaxID=1561947 RepID=UPI002548433B|nr:uncharacterized protein N7484_005453 [Penicillium longicatenatum]KAJ5642946.1 hypothetical protein N7484_005453 [Penicillium longicatenatum]